MPEYNPVYPELNAVYQQDKQRQAINTMPGGDFASEPNQLNRYLYGYEYDPSSPWYKRSTSKLTRMGQNMGWSQLASLGNMIIPGAKLGDTLFGGKIKTKSKFEEEQRKKKRREDEWKRILSGGL